MRRAFGVFLLLLALGHASAQGPREAEEPMADPAQEARVQDLASKLTCVVCQGQSVKDSNALFAEDVRFFIRARIREGDTDEAIVEKLTDRYGEGIRYSPPFGAVSALLWLAPALIVMAGGLAVARITARPKTAA